LGFELVIAMFISGERVRGPAEGFLQDMGDPDTAEKAVA
jgi:hypothetical protein